uniref:Uncharacterized protein n=1 Tax=Anguilla anguilla TaxID=7936 RepID=A0A0E9VXS9_ANGAN
MECALTFTTHSCPLEPKWSVR